MSSGPKNLPEYSERAIFVTVLNRLMNPGSDHQAERWYQAYQIVCVNPEEVLADAQVREEILKSLRESFKQGDTVLVGNKGYRRYLSVAGGSHLVIDEKKVANDAHYDGKWVLTTNTGFPVAQAVLKYKRDLKPCRR